MTVQPTVAEQLAADMARLEARPYAEVGVPMFLVAQDLRGVLPAAGGDPALAAALRAMAESCPVAAPPARLMEVLADRLLLGETGPVFTRLGEEPR